MKINLGVEGQDGRLQPVEGGDELERIPAAGERICFGDRRAFAEVVRVENLLPMDGGEPIIAVILDRFPPSPNDSRG